MKTEVKEKLERKLNSTIRDIIYIQDLGLTDDNDIQVWNKVWNKLTELGYELKSDRKSENIIKLANEWENGSRVHIHLKREYYTPVELSGIKTKHNFLRDYKLTSKLPEIRKLCRQTLKLEDYLDCEYNICFWRVLVI